MIAQRVPYEIPFWAALRRVDREKREKMRTIHLTRTAYTFIQITSLLVCHSFYSKTFSMQFNELLSFCVGFHFLYYYSILIRLPFERGAFHQRNGGAIECKEWKVCKNREEKCGKVNDGAPLEHSKAHDYIQWPQLKNRPRTARLLSHRNPTHSLSPPAH